MKSAPILIGALLLIGVKSSTIPQPTREVFKAWQQEHSRAYVTEEEQAMRFEVFKKNTMKVAEVAKANPLATFALDDFADWTAEEIKTQRPLDGPPVMHAREQSLFPEELVTKAGAIDWIAKGAVNAPVSQGRCGTCAQFSAIANIEAQWHLAGHPLVKLSEQEMIDCSSYTGPYGMGWVADVHKGIDKNVDYPLANHSITNITGCRSPCHQHWANKSFAHITGATCLPNTVNESQILAWLQHGPLSISIAAGPLNGYKGGIITDEGTCNNTHIDHAVNIVGYGTEAGVPYWKLRNSWGPAFGEGGYVRVKYGVHCLGFLGACQSYIGEPPGDHISSGRIVV